MIRAKFKVDSITSVAWSPTVRVVQLIAVCADEIPENARYHKYTPSGSLNMTIDNPSASEQFQLGKSFYVDFTPAQ